MHIVFLMKKSQGGCNTQPQTGDESELLQEGPFWCVTGPTGKCSGGTTGLNIEYKINVKLKHEEMLSFDVSVVSQERFGLYILKKQQQIILILSAEIWMRECVKLGVTSLYNSFVLLIATLIRVSVSLCSYHISF